MLIRASLLGRRAHVTVAIPENGVIFQTLEGHLRAILGTLTVEEINTDRQAFAQKMTGEAAVDLRRMGVSIDILTIQQISDEQGYLEALGKKRTAEVA
jgi:flotillin